MAPFIVFVTVAGASVLAHWLNHRRAHRPFDALDSIQRSLAYGLAAMLLVAASGHFVEPLRPGLAAIVPPFIPYPDLVITVTGFFEAALAVGITVPATRKLVAWVLVAYLITVFPANVLAATSVDHPDAPSTPLLLRGLIQVVFIASAVLIALTAQGMGMRTVIDKWRSRGSVRVPQPASPAGHLLPTDKAPAKPEGTGLGGGRVGCGGISDVGGNPRAVTKIPASRTSLTGV